MNKTTGLIHIYCGNGKGKTTTGMGLCLRAAGSGHKVLIYQFMKDNSTNERISLERIPNITFIDGLSNEKFSFQMTELEKKERTFYYESQFKRIIQMVTAEHYNVLFLDEILYTIRAGLFDERLLLDFLNHKPSDLEIILTGQGPSNALIEIADYVSEIHKIKHPFDNGINAREGIEH